MSGKKKMRENTTPSLPMKKKNKKVKKNGRIKLSTMLFLVSVVPLLLTVAVINVNSVITTRSNMEGQVSETLSVAANNLSIHCSGNKINGGTINTYNDYMDCLKEQNVEQGLILESGSGTSSIKNENDYREKEIELDKDFSQVTEGFFDTSVRIQNVEYYGYYMPVETDGEVVAIAFAGKEKTVVDEAIKREIITYVMFGFVIAVIFAVVDILAARYMSKSVKAVGKNVNALASGDLREQERASSAIREMSTLFGETRFMQSNLATTIGKVKSISKQLGNNIAEVTELSSSSVSRANAITETMKDLSATAGGMAENVQNINVQMVDMESCITDISGEVDKLYENSDVLLHSNDEAKQDMNAIMENSKRSVEAVQDILSQIKETNYSIGEIDKAVSIILDISDQTSLLSLNASIEAAKAGELGRGFAVVAEEIGKLANQSAEGAEIIKNMAQTIVQKSGVSVRLAEDIAGLITEEQKSVSNTRTTFEELSRDIEQSVVSIRNIADKTENLTDYKEKVLDNVQDLSAISEENYASNQEVCSNITEILSEVESVNTHCEKINNMAGELEKSAAYFQE